MQSRQKATIGSTVTLKMDYRDESNPHGIPATVFALSTNEVGQEIQAVMIMALYFLEKGEMRRYTLSLKKDTLSIQMRQSFHHI